MEWLLAEGDDNWGLGDYDGSGDNEDNSAMSECDNYIVRSSVRFSKLEILFTKYFFSSLLRYLLCFLTAMKLKMGMDLRGDPLRIIIFQDAENKPSEI